MDPISFIFFAPMHFYSLIKFYIEIPFERKLTSISYMHALGNALMPYLNYVVFSSGTCLHF
jgi:hypothetical protein